MTGTDDANAWGGETRPEASSLPAAAAPVERLGPYSLIKRLAAGGMAEVYLAELARPGGFKKTLVVKRILPQLASDPRYLEMFLREARTSAQLSHPNVVQVIELGEVDGKYFLAMEYVEGLTLSDLARRTWFAGRPLPLDVVAACVADAALGLACAHENSLVHRDVSPDNLMVAREGVTKVVDFGIARPQSNDRITQTGEIKGKIPYMAPEYLAGNTADPRCDIYALGVTLYWLMTGVRPFRGNSTLEEMEAIQRQPPRPPRELNPKIPEAVEALTLACLEKDPGRRPQSARTIAETLSPVTPPGRQHVAACLQDAMALPQPPRGQVMRDGVAAMANGRDSTVTLAGPPVGEATGATLTLSTRGAPSRRGVAGFAAAALGTVVVVATVGLLLARRGGEPAEQQQEPAVAAAAAQARPSALVVPIDVDGVEPVEVAASVPPLGGTEAAAVSVAVTAPETVRWLTPAGAVLGAGTTTLTLPPAVRGVVAFDSARDVRTAIPISGRPIAYDALPRGVLEVRAPTATQVFAGSKLLGVAPLTLEVVYGAWRLRCLAGKAEERKKVTVQPGSSAVVECGTAQAPGLAAAASGAASRSAAPEQRRAEAKRASDGNDWLRSDGMLELRGDTVSWTPTGLSVGNQALTLRLKDVATVSGRDQDLSVTTSWGSRYRFTVDDAAGWSRAIAAGRDAFKRR